VWLNVTEYHGLDREHYRGNEDDYRKMDRVFYIDLDAGDLGVIQNGHYDLVILSHVIEHLKSGERVVWALAEKLRPGGIIYIETPSYRTYNLPSAEGFLNFYDDPTHWRCYSVEALADGLADRGLRILGLGYRRDYIRMLLLSPLSIVMNLLYYMPVKRQLLGAGLWDLLGVAKYVIAQQKST